MSRDFGGTAKLVSRIENQPFVPEFCKINSFENPCLKM
jgi:hypothetical protein